MNDNQEKVLRQWLKSHASLFATQDDGRVLHLMELATGKQIALDLGSVEAMESKVDSATGASYLTLLLENGHQLVLCQQGFAFAPEFQNTGAIELPVTVFCMADFKNLYGQLKHNAIEHPEERRKSLDLVMLLISLLDGARQVGMDVDAESERVERLLTAIEKETPPEDS